MDKQIDELVEFFSQHSRFSRLTREEQVFLAHFCFKKPFKQEELIFHEGDPGDALYIIKQGSIKIFKSGFLGEETIAIFNEGDIYGELSLMDNYPRSTDAKANADTELIGLSQNNFESIKNQNPVLAMKIMEILLKTISMRLRTTTLRAFGQF